MAKAKKNTSSVVPSILSYRSHLDVSPGYLYGVNFDNRFDVNARYTLDVVRKTLRGVISQYGASEEDKINSNLQKIETCHLGKGCDTLVIDFYATFISNVETPQQSDLDFINNSQKLISDLRDKYGVRELANRYAYNIANARFAWNNRISAESIDVVVDGDLGNITFNAFDYSLRGFNYVDDKISALADEIEKVFKNEKDFARFHIVAYVKLYDGAKVFPSQDFVTAPDDCKTVLCQLLDLDNKKTAGMHSQKLGNALRTIDTWFDGFGNIYNMPIPVEAYGTSSFIQRAFRNGNKSDLYSLYEKMITGKNLEEEEFYFVFACLVRGGLYGQKN